MKTTDIIEKSKKLADAWFWACIREDMIDRGEEDLVREIENVKKNEIN